jgi:xanthine dehydrogenase accessory factor
MAQAVVRDVLAELMSIWRTGGTAGVATVVRTLRSAPRLPGAAMVVAPDGTVAGSVSGGCVETAGGGGLPLTQLRGRIHHDMAP